MKTIVYVDGQNFLYGVAEILFNAGIINDKQEISAIDLPFLVRKILPRSSSSQSTDTLQSAGANSLEIRYYGVTKIQQPTDYGQEVLDRSAKFAENLRRLKTYLWRTGVKYCAVGNLKIRNRFTCKQCGAEEYKYLEKGVDVGLAVDITADVLEHKVDHIVLFSSDTDITPALRVAISRGVKLTYVALTNQTTKSLMQLATNTFILETEDVAEAYARAIKVQ